MEDEHFEWFQTPHDFKILTKDQLMKIKRDGLKPKLNSTMPLADQQQKDLTGKSYQTNQSKKRTKD